MFNFTVDCRSDISVTIIATQAFNSKILNTIIITIKTDIAQSEAQEI